MLYPESPICIQATQVHHCCQLTESFSVADEQRNLTDMEIGAWEKTLLGKCGMSGITYLTKMR